MGVVLKARDENLGRDLAIKVLHESQAFKPGVVNRFIEEAQIGGQLQHPGIAPVHELGVFEDGRPFFSMKLVQGETLAELLQRRADPREDQGRFVGIFLQICQTMAYVHSRGVVHRDLKPSNIMVGAFGEVQVMDWGLAKVLSDRPIPGEVVPETPPAFRGLKTHRTGSDTTPVPDDAMTQMGCVLGTPAYMPPEQALGQIDQLDARSDVFSLGGILAEILTGKPPYVQQVDSGVMQQATAGRLDACHQRLAESGADPALVDLARHCLQRQPADRGVGPGGAGRPVGGGTAGRATAAATGADFGGGRRSGALGVVGRPGDPPGGAATKDGRRRGAGGGIKIRPGGVDRGRAGAVGETGGRSIGAARSGRGGPGAHGRAELEIRRPTGRAVRKSGAAQPEAGPGPRGTKPTGPVHLGHEAAAIPVE
jgi:hypothetical protein